MPLYEYKCEKCGQVFEIIQKFSDAPVQTHAACGGHVDRLLSAPAFHLKGTGWYATDYGKKNGNGSTHSSKTDTSAKPAETKSETSKSEPAKSESSTSKSSDTAATKS